MFVLDLLLFAQRVNSNLNPGKRGGERYEKEIEKNFSSRIGSYINMEYMRMAATGIGGRFDAADRG